MKIIIEIADNSAIARSIIDTHRQVGAQPAAAELASFIKNKNWEFIIWNMIVDRKESITLKDASLVTFQRSAA